MTPAAVGDAVTESTKELSSSTRRQVIVIAVAAFGLLGIGLLVGFARSDDPTPPNWVELTAPVEMPDVVLTDQDSQPFDLRERTRGRVTLLYFGYLNCPDACPIHMAVLGSTFEQLAPDVRSEIDVIFITTDPARDRPADLRDFLARFDAAFIGLTGPDEVLQEDQRQQSPFLLRQGIDGCETINVHKTAVFGVLSDPINGEMSLRPLDTFALNQAGGSAQGGRLGPDPFPLKLADHRDMRRPNSQPGRSKGTQGPQPNDSAGQVAAKAGGDVSGFEKHKIRRVQNGKGGSPVAGLVAPIAFQNGIHC